MAKNNFRHYNAFLRAAKAEGLTHRQAQQSYGFFKQALHRPVMGVDVARHPRLFKRAANYAVVKSDQERRDVKQSRGGGRGGGGRVIASLADYLDWGDYEDDFGEYESSEEY